MVISLIYICTRKLRFGIHAVNISLLKAGITTSLLAVLSSGAKKLILSQDCTVQQGSPLCIRQTPGASAGGTCQGRQPVAAALRPLAAGRSGVAGPGMAWAMAGHGALLSGHYGFVLLQCDRKTVHFFTCKTRSANGMTPDCPCIRVPAAAPQHSCRKWRQAAARSSAAGWGRVSSRSGRWPRLPDPLWSQRFCMPRRHRLQSGRCGR